MGVEIRGRGEGEERVGFETAWRSREGRRGEEALSLRLCLCLSRPQQRGMSPLTCINVPDQF